MKQHVMHSVISRCIDCGATQEEIFDNLMPSCDAVAVLRQRQSRADWLEARAKAVYLQEMLRSQGYVEPERLVKAPPEIVPLPYREPSPVLLDLMLEAALKKALENAAYPGYGAPMDPWDRPVSRSIIDEWTRRR